MNIGGANTQANSRAAAGEARQRGESTPRQRAVRRQCLGAMPASRTPFSSVDSDRSETGFRQPQALHATPPWTQPRGSLRVRRRL
jgi:hypothetical protein